MLSGAPPWSNRSCRSAEVFELIKTPGLTPDIPPCSETCLDFIKSCLQRNPEQRPDAQTLLNHPFILHTREQPYSPRKSMESVRASFLSTGQTKGSHIRATSETIKSLHSGIYSCDEENEDM